MTGAVSGGSADEELFQPARDGRLFATPILWPFGGKKYVVSDVSKAELIERLDRWRSIHSFFVPNNRGKKHGHRLSS